MICLPYRSLATLTLVVLLGLWPAAPVWAEPTPTQPAGNGTEAAPYLIGTLAELYWIAASDAVVATPNRAARWAAHYRQTASIDASDTATWDGGAGWTPIGTEPSRFGGTYNGDGHTIRGLFINRPGTDWLGLFGFTGQYSTVQNLGVIGVNITGGQHIGGLAGGVNSGAVVTQCFATGTVTGTNEIGGLAGSNSGTTSNSYAIVTVNGSGIVGGLVGYNAVGNIINSYAAGAVTGSTNVGGLAGKAFVATTTASFWDTQTSGQASSAGGTGKTTAEMKTLTTFTDAGWDFATTTVWQMSSAITFGGYPTLAWTRSYAVEPPLAGGLYQYQVENLAHLVWIAEASSRWANTYQQAADIDASVTAAWAGGQGWTPIGNGGTFFSGIFDGGGHTVSGLFINRLGMGSFYQGMFGVLGNGATIQNLGVADARIAGDTYVGALVAYSNGTITSCLATGTITGLNYVGGLVGINLPIGTLSDCYATSAVTATNVNAGGLVGTNDGTIGNCYAAGAVTGSTLVGGLAGNNNGTVNNAFYDTETTGQSDTGKGLPKTTAEMQTIATFSAAAWPIVAGWSAFSPPNTIWGICPDINGGYPFLLWQHDTNPCACSTASDGFYLIPNPSGNPAVIYLE